MIAPSGHTLGHQRVIVLGELVWQRGGIASRPSYMRVVGAGIRHARLDAWESDREHPRIHVVVPTCNHGNLTDGVVVEWLAVLLDSLAPIQNPLQMPVELWVPRKRAVGVIQDKRELFPLEIVQLH